MSTKLILVEGLPSTGKSTTAKMVHEILTEHHIENELFMEGNLDHPADYDGVAFLKEAEFRKLLDDFKLYKDDINLLTTKKEEGYFIEYKKGYQELKDKFPKELWEKIFENDIYELPLENHIDLIKNKWREFAHKAQNEKKINIFDCPFIQNPVTVTMVRDNADEKIIIDYIKELENKIKGLDPILIYVDQKDIKSSFKKAIDKRPKEWLDFFISYYTDQGYGKKHELKGLEGVMNILIERQRIEHVILERLEIKKHTIDNSELNYEKHKNNIKKILEDSLD